MRRREASTLALAAAVCTALCVLIVRPGYADPVPPGVPDAGTRPAAPAGGGPPDGGTVPAEPTSPPPVGQGPWAGQIATESAAVEALRVQLKRFDVELGQARATSLGSRQAWQESADALATAQERADHAVDEAYRAATALGPLDRYAGELDRLSLLAPGLRTGPDAQSAARELTRAEQAERAASAAYQAAAGTEQSLAVRRDAVQATVDRRSAALAELRRRNSAELARIETEREAADQRRGLAFDPASTVAGQRADPTAIAAVRFALAQLGHRYRWATEGPLTYDCSGLVYAAYHSVRVALPRIANEQYRATTPVSIDQLLPGDLVFFATNRADWTSVMHVGIYLGDGLMVHAAALGEVVKVAPIWSAAFFGASRVLPAVSAPRSPTAAGSPGVSG